MICERMAASVAEVEAWVKAGAGRPRRCPA